MAIQYKQLCNMCKKNYVLVSLRQKDGICYECQKNELSGEITDPEMIKLFDIPDDFYKLNSFLRKIKICYLRYGNLTEKQIAAFEKTVQSLNDKANTDE